MPAELERAHEPAQCVRQVSSCASERARGVWKSHTDQPTRATPLPQRGTKAAPRSRARARRGRGRARKAPVKTGIRK
jgi:hypothetical protein